MRAAYPASRPPEVYAMSNLTWPQTKNRIDEGGLPSAAVRSTVNHGVSRNGAPIQGGGQPDGIVRGTGRAQQVQRVRDRSGGRSRGGARGHPDHAGGLPSSLYRGAV